jgi:MoxR-like ATPase
VGKNKLVDRLLNLLNRPREYIQLHRDTTVQSLTLQPTVIGGVIVYEDSPLVKAVKQGHILVVDEADKAPLHVTCILKTLVESGEMMLSDGRRIVSRPELFDDDNVIKMHPDFRMFVLANRPGFPFLGNDFFASLGDLFSCHAIDNPSMEAELAMLRQYGPSVPENTLIRLVKAFSDLRHLADEGQVN